MKTKIIYLNTKKRLFKQTCSLLFIVLTISTVCSAQTKPGNPQPSIGIDSLIHYLSYEAEGIAEANGAPPGTYEISFSINVDEDGTLSKVQAMNNPGYGVSDLARLVNQSSPWMAANKDGKANAVKGFIVKVPYEVKDGQ